MPEIAILIPTFRRPDGLRRLLDALAGQTETRPVGIIVGENDPAGGAGAAVAAGMAAADYRFPIRIVPVPDKGLCQVRNALVGAALEDPEARWLAMIDDDEWPSPGWLAALIETQRRFDADIVGGPVVSVFDAPPSPSMSACRYFKPERHETGRVPIVWGTCNLLLTRDAVAALAPTLFDPAFNLGGGEDVEALTRLQRLGRRFAWSQAASVFEQVPEIRTRLRWVLKRAFRIGNSNMFTQLKWRQRRRPPGYALLKLAAKTLLVLPTVPVMLLLPSRRIDALCSAWLIAGQYAALRGVRYREYG